MSRVRARPEVCVTYEEFVAGCLQPLLRYAVMLTGDVHMAEDLVQETMVRVQLKWRRVGATDAPEYYVRRMITNLYVDWRRGPWLRRVMVRPEPYGSATPITPDASAETADRDQVWQLLATLPRRQRAALVLRYYCDLPDGDIAELMECAVGTVRSLISRALATLRAEHVPTSVAVGGRAR